MMIADRLGIISSILSGPDQRTRITSQTKSALFTVYAPPGLEKQAVYRHLQDIQANILLITPEATTELLEVVGGY
jgi:hypothetical protein